MNFFLVVFTLNLSLFFSFHDFINKKIRFLQQDLFGILYIYTAFTLFGIIEHKQPRALHFFGRKGLQDIQKELESYPKYFTGSFRLSSPASVFYTKMNIWQSFNCFFKKTCFIGNILGWAFLKIFIKRNDILVIIVVTTNFYS